MILEQFEIDSGVDPCRFDDEQEAVGFPSQEMDIEQPVGIALATVAWTAMPNGPRKPRRGATSDSNPDPKGSEKFLTKAFFQTLVGTVCGGLLVAAFLWFSGLPGKLESLEKGLAGLQKTIEGENGISTKLTQVEKDVALLRGNVEVLKSQRAEQVANKQPQNIELADLKWLGDQAGVGKDRVLPLAPPAAVRLANNVLSAAPRFSSNSESVDSVLRAVSISMRTASFLVLMTTDNYIEKRLTPDGRPIERKLCESFSIDKMGKLIVTGPCDFPLDGFNLGRVTFRKVRLLFLGVGGMRLERVSFEDCTSDAELPIDTEVERKVDELIAAISESKRDFSLSIPLFSEWRGVAPWMKPGMK